MTSTYVTNLLWPSLPFSIAQHVVAWAFLSMVLIKNNNNRGKPKSESKIHETKDVGFFFLIPSHPCHSAAESSVFRNYHLFCMMLLATVNICVFLIFN